MRNTWVFPDQKILYTQLPKNACSSIKWMLAEVSGQDPQGFRRALSDEQSRRMLVHNRRLWKGVGRLSEMSPESRAEISQANGWFVFAVVRDPRLRAWSAWQSKFLVGDPVYVHRKFAGAPWLPRVPKDAGDVLEDWRRFVDALAAGDGPVRDGHFRSQADRLSENQIPYDRIYEMRELSRMLEDLGAHLERRGQPHDLAMPRENDTPLAAGREVFDDGVLEQLETIYAGDFARFGHLWDLGPTLAKEISWDRAAMTDIGQRVAHNERIADLFSIGRRERSRRRDLEDALAKRVAVGDAPATALVGELGRRARRKVGRVVGRGR
ncbi:sulfotransferase family 2 domain-containing protein [Isoptericola sp. b408]|uniref:sulfotransferase family 2 domain-containing protein n=1 Tax=Isoptericola sp. b408 TaxID=3064653 RepID=UPI002712A1FD|nr:sulfotransferase family 2 domain-containing protein [Isoptericola sp. b408]MDO8152727.1 sulfotransferase family 2 domain-containing protein [Isoptericola sp. b408]